MGMDLWWMTSWMLRGSMRMSEGVSWEHNWAGVRDVISACTGWHFRYVGFVGHRGAEGSFQPALRSYMHCYILLKRLLRSSGPVHSARHDAPFP